MAPHSSSWGATGTASRTRTASWTRTASHIIADHETLDRSRRIGADARAALTPLARLVVGRQGHRPTTTPGWTFLTNHGHALVCIARNGDIRLRDLASSIGVTERTAQIIVINQGHWEKSGKYL